MAKNKYLKVVIISVAIMAIISGCDKNDSDKNSQNKEANAHKQGENTGLRKQFEDVEWKEEFTILDSKGNDLNVVIDADIVVPELDYMSVIEIEDLEFTGKNKERLVQSLFDKTDIFYNDDEHKSKEQWQKKIDSEINNYIDIYEKFLADCPPDVDPDAGDLWMGEIQKLQDLKVEYEKKMNEASSEFVPVDNYDSDSYLGYINEILYTMTFETELLMHDDETGEGCGPITYEITVNRYDMEGVGPEEISDTFGSYSAGEVRSEENHDEKNRCSMSRDEAVAYAERYLNAIGIPGGVCTAVTDLCWGGTKKVENNYEEVQVFDGYAITFQLGINDIALNSYGVTTDYWTYMEKQGDAVYESMECYAEIKISDQGLIGMKIYNPVALQGITNDVGMLAMDDVCDIIKDEISNNVKKYEKLINADYEFNKLELIQFRVKDSNEKNKFSYLPVWRLSNNEPDIMDEEIEMIYNEVLVNAIDGSVINFMDEILIEE